MKKICLILVALAMTCVTSWAKDEIPSYDYELSLSQENIAATSGYKVFKVWSFGKKKELLTNDICMRNAIHGILFKGLVAADAGTQGNVPALVPSGYESHKEYFDLFFESGEYKQFIQLTSRGAQQAGDVVKLPKKGYRVGLLVQVNINALRKRLEKDGIVTGVKDLFKS